MRVIIKKTAGSLEIGEQKRTEEGSVEKRVVRVREGGAEI